MATTNADIVNASETTFRIIETLKELNGAGVTEVSKSLDLPKSTVHNHLATLLKNEYVVKDDGEYQISLQFLEFGEYIRNQMKIYEIAQPEVDQLASETGELANVLIEEHGKGVYLYRSKGQRAVRIETYAGMRVNLHASSLGKAILAYLPDERVSDIIDRHGLPGRTRYTITDENQLWEELEEIRERGYAYDEEEQLVGLRCVSAPIKDETDVAVGAISVSGPTSRMKGERYREELPELVLNAANVVELNMRHS